MNLFKLLEGAARRYPTKTATFHGATPCSNYSELHLHALWLGGWLNARSSPGDRALIIAPNCTEYLEILFGCWAAGLIAVPVNAKLHPREIAQVKDDVQPRIIFTTAAILEGLTTPGAAAVPVVEIASKLYHDILQPRDCKILDLRDDHIAWLFFTSGTTGRSKGAMLSHRALSAMSVAHLADFEPLESRDAIIHAAPMSHGSGLLILPYVARGAAHIVPSSGSYIAEEFLALCATHGRCGAFLAPTMLRRLRLHAELQPAGTIPAIRSIIYGGGPMYLDELRKSLALFGPIFCHLYGQGESPMTITGLRRTDHLDDEAILTSVGWPRSGMEVAIHDAAGKPLGAGEVGEIVCRGATLMSGYWQNPEASAATIVEGWLRTGDLGSLDLDGKLRLAGRSKELIVSGGSNIYPIEVETVLLSHPAVSEACVIGKPDPEWGEIAVAFVVVESGQHADAAMLDRYCREHIAAYKKPKLYRFIEALPKNANGKVKKTELAV